MTKSEKLEDAVAPRLAFGEVGRCSRAEAMTKSPSKKLEDAAAPRLAFGCRELDGYIDDHLHGSLNHTFGKSELCRIMGNLMLQLIVSFAPALTAAIVR